MEDFGFYLVMTNPRVGYERCCEAAVAAGVRMVQLRMKDVPRATLLDMAKRLVPIVRGSATRLIIDDDASVAAEAGADGVHVAPCHPGADRAADGGGAQRRHCREGQE